MLLGEGLTRAMAQATFSAATRPHLVPGPRPRLRSGRCALPIGYPADWRTPSAFGRQGFYPSHPVKMKKAAIKAAFSFWLGGRDSNPR